ncbi:hypothetical protein AZSI13_09800 [Azospira sp. I13]|uniref:YhdP family protein n=1 Tax=Azospira sp. I13 TaxID=1765050 RepID=UPI000D4A14DF|nr:YhdP family protein [Azospira sp. I13]GBG01653.1 hypothetical protein AZSI13_09800 [Azospira sp. I13]
MAEPADSPADSLADASLRPALYHRLHRLLPFVASPGARVFWRRAGRLSLWAGVVGYFAFAFLVLALRYWVLPHVGDYRGDIERAASRALGLPVTIGHIDAGWRGLRPELTLADVRVADRQGNPALAFQQVDSVLSWWSVPSLSLRLHLLEIQEPTLLVRRNADGSFEVAGIPVESSGSDDGGALNWVLAQHRIHIKDATIVWEDLQRGAPPLTLEAVNLLLENSGSRHRFGLSALPPPELASRLDVRGDLRGGDPTRLEDWSGQLYTQFDSTDLAAWQAWVDYPVSLPKGHGALRLWLEVDEGLPVAATADVGLRDLRLQLAKDLPELDLLHLQGRISGQRRKGDTRLNGRQLSLATRAGVTLEPTDFAFTWQEGGLFSDRRRGSGSANTLDLGALAALAGHLPLGQEVRQWLEEYEPRGQVQDLKAVWSDKDGAAQEYNLKARFSDLGIKASTHFPGFAGMSGSVDAGDRGGSLTLRSQKATLDLPQVFPEPRIAVDSLTSQVSWKIEGPKLEVSLDNFAFTSPDATGSAQGTYRLGGEGPGTIDLTAGISKADGTAVWRYMPLAVSQDARDWLKTAITGGTASEAKLILKGDLARFPFLDPKEGQFLVTARIHNATLDYGTGWPRIDDIQGSLRFEAARMLIEAKSARLLGARLAAVKAEIPDLDAPEELLKITGKAEGPTAEFLKFIDQSPVGNKIDNFTEDMRAGGEGRLNLAIDMPLRHLVDTKVKGEFEFLNNQVTVEPGLPPITQVNGRLHFTDGGISIKEVTGQLLGGPLRLYASNEGDKVLVNASGNLTALALRRQLDLPLFDNLSGSAAWKGEVRVRKKSAEMVIESDLKGLASSLPEPFNKPASQTLPLRLERAALPDAPARKGAPPPVSREQVKFSLGKLAAAQLIRRRESAGLVLERGALALGEPLVLPERGLTLTIAQPSVDVDYWRQALLPPNGSSNGSSNNSNASGSAQEASLPLSQVLLKTPLLDAGGRRFHDVVLKASPTGTTWQLDLLAKEASGQIQWDGSGQGRVRARLKHLILPEATPQQAAMEKMGEAERQDELPGLDITADSFTLGSRRFGKLELLARNEGRVWRLDKVALNAPEGTINGKGLWRTDPRGAHRTDVEFRLEAGDAGKYLDRLGFPGTLKRGSATLAGKLAWNGTPTGLDVPSLSGDLKLTAEKGQFAKIEPGIGKLIGLLSLQTLPRRITLDFRDVFSEGFAFDSIEGTFKVQNGLMKTSDLAIDGPAAKVGIKGDINLDHETQNLRVRVQPALGSSVALGTAALVNPVAGVAALIAQKILQNPVDQIFAFEYAVTGNWEDPKVDKLSGGDKSGDKSPNSQGAKTDEPAKP